MIRKEIGSALIFSDRSGHCFNQPKGWPVTIVVEIGTDDDDIEYGPNGIDFVYGRFLAVFGESVRPGHVFDHPYCNEGFAKGVNDFLSQHGIQGNVGWSEMGRQTNEHADFDASYSIFEQFFPERFAAAKAAYDAQRPEPIPDGVVEFSATKQALEIRVKNPAGQVVDSMSLDFTEKSGCSGYTYSTVMTLARDHTSHFADTYCIKRIKRVKAKA